MYIELNMTAFWKINWLKFLLLIIICVIITAHIMYEYMDTNALQLFSEHTSPKKLVNIYNSNSSDTVYTAITSMSMFNSTISTSAPFSTTNKSDGIKDNNLTNFHEHRTEAYFIKDMETSAAKRSLKQCKDPCYEDGGPIMPNITLEPLDLVEAELRPFLKRGGNYTPTDCIPKYHVALIIPFRDRYAHLSIFLRNIHPFLMKQNIAYRIFVIEQTNGKPFNRAAMMNVGFLESLKMFPWDCFIFHDVDLLPLDNRNLYNCPRQPRHMSVAIDTLKYKLPYETIFGGVSAMTRAHFESVNGFSNSFYGWGGEDDDMANRIKRANLFISRYPVNIARYMMLKHQKEKANPKRYETLVNGYSKMEMDGINSIKYEIYSFKESPIFTWYLVELKYSDQTYL